jgi:hypothetical protein
MVPHHLLHRDPRAIDPTVCDVAKRTKVSYQLKEESETYREF